MKRLLGTHAFLWFSLNDPKDDFTFVSADQILDAYGVRRIW